MDTWSGIYILTFYYIFLSQQLSHSPQKWLQNSFRLLMPFLSLNHTIYLFCHRKKPMSILIPSLQSKTKIPYSFRSEFFQPYSRFRVPRTPNIPFQDFPVPSVMAIVSPPVWPNSRHQVPHPVTNNNSKQFSTGWSLSFV